MNSLLLLALLSPIAHAEPLILGVSGRLVDAEGAPLDGAQSVQVSLYADPAQSPLWSASRPATATDGFVRIELTGVDDTGDVLDVSVLQGDQLWVGLSTATAPEVRQRLVHVPRAAQMRAVPVGTTTGSCEAEGILRFNPTSALLFACHEGSWVPAGF